MNQIMFLPMSSRPRSYKCSNCGTVLEPVEEELTKLDKVLSAFFLVAILLVAIFGIGFIVYAEMFS